MTPFTVQKLLAVLTPLIVSISATGPYLTQQEAIDLDTELYSTYKFSRGQLMELAGLSAASIITQTYPPGKVLVVCGCGKNGGNGLVCARHLKIFGYETVLYYPKSVPGSIYENLVYQCKLMNITMLNEEPIPGVDELDQDYKLIVDALFGASFKPPVRQEFVHILENLRKTRTPIASIDIPSGWDVDSGPTSNDFCPELLISVSAPKLCAKFFNGKYHYLGGLLVPLALQQKYNVSQLPPYPSNKCFVKLK